MQRSRNRKSKFSKCDYVDYFEYKIHEEGNLVLKNSTLNSVNRAIEEWHVIQYYKDIEFDGDGKVWSEQDDPRQIIVNGSKFRFNRIGNQKDLYE